MSVARPVTAASGMPDSPKFGFGAHIHPWGIEPHAALEVASRAGLDWIAIDYNWARQAPDKNTPPSLEPLERVFSQARSLNLNVLLSISHAPDWAMAGLGPDSARVNGMVAEFANRYADVLLAIELFPGANTIQGWGTQPDPVAYAMLLQQVTATLKSMDSKVLLVAGGLVPMDLANQNGTMNDVEFLQRLYQAGATANMPVISLRLENLTGDAMAAPSQQTQNVLRHYEVIRQVMLANQHEHGIIWITGYTFPTSLAKNMFAEQSRWLNQAMQLMKSQLYIGAAFFDSLNPSEQPEQALTSLISYHGGQISLHPALESLAQIVALGKGEAPGPLQIALVKRLVSGTNKLELKSKTP